MMFNGWLEGWQLEGTGPVQPTPAFLTSLAQFCILVCPHTASQDRTKVLKKYIEAVSVNRLVSQSGTNVSHLQKQTFK